MDAFALGREAFALGREAFTLGREDQGAKGEATLHVRGKHARRAEVCRDDEEPEKAVYSAPARIWGEGDANATGEISGEGVETFVESRREARRAFAVLCPEETIGSRPSEGRREYATVSYRRR